MFFFSVQREKFKDKTAFHLSNVIVLSTSHCEQLGKRDEFEDILLALLAAISVRDRKAAITGRLVSAAGG